MNQFREMLREAFAGAEPYDPVPQRPAIEAAIEQIGQRDRMMRVLVWFAVTFLTVVAVWAGWSFFALEDPSPRALILRATLFLWAILGVWFMKMLLFVTQRELAIHRELKRTQLMLLDMRAGG